MIGGCAGSATSAGGWGPHTLWRGGLQDSLGGNTRTTVIATLGPMSEHKDESVSTLLFADRASRVVTRVRRNEVVDDAVLLSRAQVRGAEQVARVLVAC